jgi:hypothetical protein
METKIIKLNTEEIKEIYDILESDLSRLQTEAEHDEMCLREDFITARKKLIQKIKKELVVEVLDDNETDLVLEKINAQIKYTYDTGSALFAPTSGICWTCNKQIYNKITLEEAGEGLITGCPYCHSSFDD